VKWQFTNGRTPAEGQSGLSYRGPTPGATRDNLAGSKRRRTFKLNAHAHLGGCDHHILNLHHVYEAMGQSIYDWLFLLSGVVFIVGGLVAIRSARNVVSLS
jgi:hypothetical protein